MPIYEYGCAACGAVTDIKHGFKETNSSRCAACGGELRRIFNPAGIVFKGSGFYVTDSRPAGSNSDGGAKSETKSDAKTETKSDTKASGSKSDAAA